MEPISVIYLLGAFLLLVGALMSRVEVGRCSECPHCRAEAAAAESRARATVAALERRRTFPRCARCGRSDPHEHNG